MAEIALHVMTPEERALRRKRITRETLTTVFFHVACIFIAFWMVLPFYWSVLSSFRPKDEISSFYISWFPNVLTLENYNRVFSEIDFFRLLRNSLFTSLTGLFTNLFFGTLAAYSFAKLRFKGHKIVFNIMLISMMIPGVITLIPTFLVIVKFPLVGGNNIIGQGGNGFYDSHAAVILPGAIGVYGIFFMRQFFVSLSDEFGESARVDGASEIRIFLQIYVPMVLPGLLTLGVFTFQSGWNNFMWPNIVLISENVKLLTQAFGRFRSPQLTEYGPLMALSTLMILPIIVIFIFAQKYFIKGISVGGIRG